MKKKSNYAALLLVVTSLFVANSHASLRYSNNDLLKAVISGVTVCLLCSQILKNKYSGMALLEAAGDGHIDIVKKILDKCPEDELFDLISIKKVNKIKKIDYATLLLIAMVPLVANSNMSWRHFNRDFLEDLIYGAFLGGTFLCFLYLQTLKDEHGGATALHLAALNGYVDIVKEILGKCPEDKLFDLISMKNKYGDTALHLAADSGCLGVVKEILGKCPEDKLFDLISMKNKYGRTAFHEPALNGYVDIVKEILERCSEDKLFDLVSIKDENGRTAFHLATYVEHVETVKKLLNIYELCIFKTKKNKYKLTIKDFENQPYIPKFVPQINIQRDIAQDVFIKLKEVYNRRYDNQEISNMIRQSICNIAAYCLYDIDDSISKKHGHKKNLDKYIKTLIDKGFSESVPPLIKDYYAVFTNDAVSKTDYTNNKKVTEHFCMSPKQLKLDIKCARAAKKCFKGDVSKDEKSMKKNLFLTQKNNQFTDFEICFN